MLETEGGLAVDEFKKICPPADENNLDKEWLLMCGFFVKGWVACAQHGTQAEVDTLGEKLSKNHARLKSALLSRKANGQ